MKSTGGTCSPRTGDDIDVSLLHLRLWRAAAPEANAASRQTEDAGREYLRTRRPGDSPTVLFDCNYYANQLPVFVRNTIDPLEHYLRAGWALGLSPHVAFDSAFLAEQLGITEWTEPPLITYFETPIEVSPHALFSVDVYGRS